MTRGRGATPRAGGLPATWCNAAGSLPALQVLQLDGNQLTGALPDYWGSAGCIQMRWAAGGSPGTLYAKKQCEPHLDHRRQRTAFIPLLSKVASGQFEADRAAMLDMQRTALRQINSRRMRTRTGFRMSCKM